MRITVSITIMYICISLCDTVEREIFVSAFNVENLTHGIFSTLNILHKFLSSSQGDEN